MTKQANKILAIGTKIIKKKNTQLLMISSAKKDKYLLEVEESVEEAVGSDRMVAEDVAGVVEVGSRKAVNISSALSLVLKIVIVVDSFGLVGELLIAELVCMLVSALVVSILIVISVVTGEVTEVTGSIVVAPSIGKSRLLV